MHGVTMKFSEILNKWKVAGYETNHWRGCQMVGVWSWRTRLSDDKNTPICRSAV